MADGQTRKEAQVEFEQAVRSEFHGDYCRKCEDWMDVEDRWPEDDQICRSCGKKIEEQP